MVCTGFAAGCESGPRLGGRHRILQPRRPGDSERHRAPGICRAGRRPAISKTRKLALVARAALGKLRMSAAIAAGLHAVYSDRHRSLRWRIRFAGASRVRRQEFLLCVSGAAASASARRCARFTPSCGAAMTLLTTAASAWKSAATSLPTGWTSCTALSRASPPTIPCCWR